MIALLAARPTGFGETGWIGRWSPGIGDPTVMGWVTVVCYFVAAYWCFRVVQGLSKKPERRAVADSRERLLWRILLVLLVALGINKQLDLQSAMAESLRILAREQGWYEHRGEYQRAFIEVLAVLTALGGTALVAFTWKLPRAVKIAGLGLCLLGAFVLIRASSFHYMDALIRQEVHSLRLNWIFELGGIGVIALGAASRISQLKGAKLAKRGRAIAQ